MPLYTREQLPALLRQASEQPSRVFLLTGERYLCQAAAEQIVTTLLAKTGGTVHPIDGDQEDFPATLAKLRTFSLLPGRQIYRVTDTRLFHSRQVARTIWDRAVKAQAENKPDQAARALLALLASGGLEATPGTNDLAAMTETEWQQCFGFPRPDGDLAWTRPLLETGAATADGSSPATAPDDLLARALASGLPGNNFLLLLAFEVDKRKKLFKMLKDEQSVLDLSVEGGAGAKAQKEQRTVLADLVRQTLAEQGKSMPPALMDLLLERVGFHPMAVVMELRKVMAYLGDRTQVSREDLDLLVGRTRQEALFELTTALQQGDRERALLLADRLQENGIHPLAVVATLRNFVRGLLLCRALLEQPELGYQASMSAAVFQQTCLPRLKEKGRWKKELGGHPFALFMQFKTAANLPLPLLSSWLHHLLRAEFRLKGSPIAAATVVQHLILSLLAR